MITKTKSNMILYGEVDDDLVERIHRRVLQSTKHFKIVYNASSVILSWTDNLSRLQYVNLTEDVSSLFNAVNIPA